MIDIKDRWSSVAHRAEWRARGASFVAKVKATKVVWFPPKATETGAKATSQAKKTTKRATKKASGTAKRARPARKTAKKTA